MFYVQEDASLWAHWIHSFHMHLTYLGPVLFPCSPCFLHSPSSSAITVGVAASAESHLGFPGGSGGRESTCNAGYLGSVPGLGRSPGGGHGSPLRFLAWRIPWTEDPGGRQSMGSQRVGHNWVTKHRTVHSHLEARNPWWLWQFLFINMAGDIFISQGITLSFQVVNNFVSPQLHQGILLSGVLTQRHACPPHHLPQGGPRTEKESVVIHAILKCFTKRWHMTLLLPLCWPKQVTWPCPNLKGKYYPPGKPGMLQSMQRVAKGLNFQEFSHWVTELNWTIPQGTWKGENQTVGDPSPPGMLMEGTEGVTSVELGLGWATE